MFSDALWQFDVTAHEVTSEQGVPIVWQGRQMNSGRVTIALGQPRSRGMINHLTGNVDVASRVRIRFDELCETLNDLGADPELTKPLDAIIRSRGSMFDPTARWRGEIGDHRLFDRDQTHIDIRAPSL